MENKWLKISPSLTKGIEIINTFEETRSEQLMKRIAVKLRNHDNELFSEEEREKLQQIFNVDENKLILAIKTILYLLKRMFKYVFQPIHLKGSLECIGLNDAKVDLFLKIWSNNIKSILNDINSDDFNISWDLRAELSNEYQKKLKIPKAYLSISGKNCSQDLELTHSELYSMFLQFEAIQTELDTVM